MSLINQMLRDLDARHAPKVDRATLPDTLHPLPPEPPQRGRKLAGGLLVAAAAVAYWLTRVVDPAPAASPPPAPRQAQTQALTPAPPPQAPPQTQPAAPAPVEAAVPPLAVALPPPSVPALAPPKPAPLPATPPAAPVAAKPKAEPSPKPRPEPKPPGVKEGAAEAAALAAPPPVEAPNAEASAIDKRPRTAPANEAAEAEYRKAMAALRRGTVSEAAAGLRAALGIDPRHVFARQALLSVLVEQQHWQDAQALVEEGLAIDPAQSGWAMTLARLQFEHGKLAEAADTLARHAPHAERNADYQAFHALLLQKQRRFAEAAQRYRAALTLKPDESRWWYGLGLALEAEQKPQEARAAFLKARDTGNLTPEIAAAVQQRLR